MTSATDASPPDTAARTTVPAVSLRGLVKRFDDVAAVDGVDLDIATGEFFSMLGPSGSGKTTVLRLIGGTPLLQLSHGVDRTLGPYWTVLIGWVPPLPPDN